MGNVAGASADGWHPRNIAGRRDGSGCTAHGCDAGVVLAAHSSRGFAWRIVDSGGKPRRTASRAPLCPVFRIVSRVADRRPVLGRIRHRTGFPGQRSSCYFPAPGRPAKAGPRLENVRTTHGRNPSKLPPRQQPTMSPRESWIRLRWPCGSRIGCSPAIRSITCRYGSTPRVPQAGAKNCSLADGLLGHAMLILVAVRCMAPEASFRPWPCWLFCRSSDVASPGL